MKIKSSSLRKIIREEISRVLEAQAGSSQPDSDTSDPAYVDDLPTPSHPMDTDSSEMSCEEYGELIVSLNGQLSAKGADVNAIHRKIELATAAQAKACS